MSFPFENLHVYKESIRAVRDLEVLCASLKGKVSYPFLDQLTRAALSVPLNIAEGNGRWHKREKQHFFQIARGSVFEIVAVLQVLNESSRLSVEQYDRFYQHMQVIAKMLTSLIGSIDKVMAAKSL